MARRRKREGQKIIAMMRGSGIVGRDRKGKFFSKDFFLLEGKEDGREAW